MATLSEIQNDQHHKSTQLGNKSEFIVDIKSSRKVSTSSNERTFLIMKKPSDTQSKQLTQQSFKKRQRSLGDNESTRNSEPKKLKFCWETSTKTETTSGARKCNDQYSMDEVSQLTTSDSMSNLEFEDTNEKNNKNSQEMNPEAFEKTDPSLLVCDNHNDCQSEDSISGVMQSFAKQSRLKECNLHLFSNIVAAATVLDEENTSNLEITNLNMRSEALDKENLDIEIISKPQSLKINKSIEIAPTSTDSFLDITKEKKKTVDVGYHTHLNQNRHSAVKADFDGVVNSSCSMGTERVQFLFRAVAEASKQLENDSIKILDTCIITEESKDVLSDYNHLLIQNIELYQADKSDRSSKVGLRCIHCAQLDEHYTAASFFPSTIGCLASGLGTISARHFFGEKCPAIPRAMVNELRITKKSSASQTRMSGKLGLDAFCRNMAKQKSLYDSKEGGIFFCGQNLQNNRSSIINKDINRKTLYSTQPKSKLPEVGDFIPSSRVNFWECRHCNSIPYPWRASGSVIFKSDAPSIEDTKKHLSKCKGNKSLTIPRSATMTISNENERCILIKWDKNTGLHLSERLNSKAFPYGSLDRRLMYDQDKDMTTDFHYYNMMQLKMTRLTKVGGSRGACPMGFPGLQCIHCKVREFFYTSADHLRNSFSHVPSHLMECPECPIEVKNQIESLKLIRNKQKSLLKIGSHKFFIDRVWERMHTDKSDSDFLSDDESLESLASSQDEGGVQNQVVDALNDNQSMTNDDTCNGGLVFPSDRHLTSNFVYLALRQVEPYNLTAKDVAQGRGTFEVGFPGLICKHCMGQEGSRKFFNRSAYHLRNAFAKVPDHLMICTKCPNEIKKALATFKKTRSKEESQLKRGSNIAFMDRVWGRLIMLDKSKKPSPLPNINPYISQLVSSEDAHLVTEFTLFTMQQMIPCNLSMTGNGARSTFEVGFPGLECRHCSGYPSARRFFYRTAEILGGNYAHIPNHLMSCSKCPLEIKATLELKKESHAQQKSKLSRGSQRTFFLRLWTRLHGSNSNVQLAEDLD